MAETLNSSYSLRYYGISKKYDFMKSLLMVAQNDFGAKDKLAPPLKINNKKRTIKHKDVHLILIDNLFDFAIGYNYYIQWFPEEDNKETAWKYIFMFSEPPSYQASMLHAFRYKEFYNRHVYGFTRPYNELFSVLLLYRLIHLKKYNTNIHFITFYNAETKDKYNKEIVSSHLGENFYVDIYPVFPSQRTEREERFFQMASRSLHIRHDDKVKNIHTKRFFKDIYQMFFGTQPEFTEKEFHSLMRIIKKNFIKGNSYSERLAHILSIKEKYFPNVKLS